MKAYVTGYRSKDEKKDEEHDGPVTSFERDGNVDVFFHKDAKWRTASAEGAKAECQCLQNMNVRVGAHFCEFSVEELPEGDFAIVCLSHPDWEKRST